MKLEQRLYCASNAISGIKRETFRQKVGSFFSRILKGI